MIEIVIALTLLQHIKSVG